MNIKNPYPSSRIRDRDKAKQLVNFSGMQLGQGIYPTDIDGLIEYKDTLYILFEIKYKSPFLPAGQKLALERVVNDFTKAGKDAVVFVATHNVWNPYHDIRAEECVVERFYYGGIGRWVNLGLNGIELGDATEQFKSDPKKFVAETVKRVEAQRTQENNSNDEEGHGSRYN